MELKRKNGKEYPTDRTQTKEFVEKQRKKNRAKAGHALETKCERINLWT